jgi:hypothetical protein
MRSRRDVGMDVDSLLGVLSNLRYNSYSFVVNNHFVAVD